MEPRGNIPSLILKFLFPYYSVPSQSRFSNFFTESNYSSTSSSSSKSYKRSMSINLEYVANGKDKRTTLMIKNIPLNLTKKDFIDICNLTNYINYCYIPFNETTGKILGFAFLNVSKYIYIIDIYKKIKYEDNLQLKHCELVYANVQGLKNLIKTFGNSVYKLDD